MDRRIAVAALLATACWSGAALAQESKPVPSAEPASGQSDASPEVVVTGSRIARRDTHVADADRHGWPGCDRHARFPDNRDHAQPVAPVHAGRRLGVELQRARRPGQPQPSRARLAADAGAGRRAAAAALESGRVGRPQRVARRADRKRGDDHGRRVGRLRIRRDRRRGQRQAAQAVHRAGTGRPGVGDR